VTLDACNWQLAVMGYGDGDQYIKRFKIMKKRRSKLAFPSIGKLEERLPFVVVRLPPRLMKVNRRLAAALEVNAARLTTPFDIYETLSDLRDFDGTSRHGCDRLVKRGCSLLSEIPSERTCESAGVLAHWCACHETDPVDHADTAVTRAAHAVVRPDDVFVFEIFMNLLTLFFKFRSRLVTLGELTADNC